MYLLQDGVIAQSLHAKDVISNRNVTCKFLTVFLLLPHGVNCHATSNLILCDTTQTYFIINLAIKMILSDKTSIIHCLSTKNSLVMLYIQNVQPSGAYPGFLEWGFIYMYKGVWVRFADFFFIFLKYPMRMK